MPNFLRCLTISCGFLPLLLWTTESAAKSPRKLQKQILPKTETSTRVRVDDKDLPKSFYKLSLKKFIDTYKKGVPEKLYLQLDKPYYCSGEKIWFKGYLVNAVTLSYPRPTRFIYVELIDQQDSVIKRIKVLTDMAGFNNCLEIPQELPSGNYLLRGYTQWMRNDGEAFFFKRVIPVLNPAGDISPAIGFASGISAEAARNKTQAAEPVHTPGTSSKHAEETEKAFDIQFLPEGGHLLPLGPQVVAFKAVGPDGLSVEVTGRVFDNRGHLVSEIASIHKGMGRFSFSPQNGQHYRAEVASQYGDTVWVDLPAVESSGCALTVAKWRRLLCNIAVTPDIDLQRLGIMILSRGKILASEEFRQNEWFKEIDTDYLMPGICHILVVDRVTRTPIAERLFFVKDKRPVQVAISPRGSAAERKQVGLHIEIANSRGAPVEGSFALSVTDHNLVRPAAWGDDIYSYLLMSSDLKGHIEDPAYYFKDNDPQTEYKLDLLMLTQGWSRFNISEALNDIYPPHPYPAEVIQRFSGEITGVSHREVKDVSLLFSILRHDYTKRVSPKDSSRFSYTATIPDSTVFVIMALDKSDKMRGIRLKVDQDSFPAVHRAIPHLSTPDSSMLAGMRAYTDHHLQYTPTHRQASAPVPAPMPVAVFSPPVETHLNATQENFFGLKTNLVADPKLMQVYAQSTALIALEKGILQGVTVKERIGMDGTFRRVKYLDSYTKPIGLIIIDSMPYPADTKAMALLSTLQVGMMESIGTITADDPQLSRYGLQGLCSMLLIRMKGREALGQALSPMPAMVMISPLGFKRPAEFYQPKYETTQEKADPKPDLRTTLYWNPEVGASCDLTFYTGDRPAVYDITLEGVTKDGQVCRFVKTIDLTKK